MGTPEGVGTDGAVVLVGVAGALALVTGGTGTRTLEV